MNPTTRRILAATFVALTGCASPRAVVSKAPPTPATRAAAPAVDPKATLALSELQPRVTLVAPTTNPANARPPIEAVLLYAQARIALTEGEHSTAQNRLEKAIVLDPLSYELHRTLGRLYLGTNANWDENSIAMLERAAAIEPDHLDLQTDLGRQYMAKGDTSSGLRHLRQALLTSQYDSDIAQATLADFFLSAALLGEGYERAALEIYQRLADRLASPNMALRMRPEVALLIGHLDEINSQIAGLLVRQRRYDEAALLLTKEVEHNPTSIEPRVAQVHALLAANRKGEAARAATATVESFNANADSLSLLREAYRSAGHESEAAAAVSRLHLKHPGNRPLFYALLDMLRADGHDVEARHLLEEAAARSPEDIEILRRRFDVVRGHEGNAAAARLLIETVAAHPDLATETMPLWWPLLRPSPTGHLRYTELSAVTVSASAAASKAFWIARVAASAHRDDVARHALAEANKESPAFAPACRELLDDIWSQPDLDTSARAGAVQDLIDRSKNSGGASLAAELRGLQLLRQGKPKDAADALAQAVQFGGRSPDLLMERVEALRQSADDPAADALLWKLISDHPSLSEAYLELFASLVTRGVQGQAEHVISTWLANDPQNHIARRMKAFEDLRAGRNDVAEAELLRLFHERPGDAQAVADLGLFYTRKQHPEQFALHLQEHLAQDPGDLAAASALAGAYAAQNLPIDAAKVLDAARAACAKDPDLLYALSAINARIGGKDASQSLLREVLRLDPSHPGAANDLGYVMTEQGRNLAEAESLIRGAVEAEPHNASFLDSMGWLLYKRGRFEEARTYLDRAVGGAKAGEAAPQPDPVVLDHRGDVFYRLGRREDAAADWRRAAERVTELHGNRDDAPDDVKSLQRELQTKARQLKEGQAVEVAPIESPATQPASIGKF